MRAASLTGMPTSCAMSFASSSVRALRPSETFCRHSARLSTGVRLQPSKAARAAATAASMSFSVPAGTCPMTSPVPALCTAIVSREDGATHSPPMKSLSRVSMEGSSRELLYRQADEPEHRVLFESRPHLRRDGERLDSAGLVGMGLAPRADLVALDRARRALEHRVLHLEGLLVPAGNARFDHDLVVVPGGGEKACLGFDDRQADDAVPLLERMPAKPGGGEQQLRALVEPREVVRIEHDVRGVEVPPVDLDGMVVSSHPNLTYSKSSGWLLIPRSGGEIQLANFPGSTTRPISDCTNARSFAVGSQAAAAAASHASRVTTRPSGEIGRPAKLPICRLNPLCGSLSWKSTPFFWMTRFQRATPASVSWM